MDRTEIMSKITEILSQQLGVREKDITMNADLFNDLGADSLDDLEIAMDLEDEFDIEIEEDECNDVHSVEDLINLIVDKIG